MVDINPAESVSRFTPRETTIVDAVAESKRIAEQQMRSNPMKDARIDSGLTRWLGNYGGDLVWIGEITPSDVNLLDDFGNVRKQRGFVVQRDDPGQNFAITLYDSSPEVGLPLQQTLTISDGTGTRLLQESFVQKGRRFPDKAIPLYPRVSIDNGANAASAELVWAGEGNLIGTHMHFVGGWALGAGPPTVSNFVRYSGGGVTINTATTTTAPNHRTDITPIWEISDYVNVEWYVWRSGGTGLYYPRPSLCRNYSDI